MLQVTEFTAAPTFVGAHDSAWSSKIRRENFISPETAEDGTRTSPCLLKFSS